MGKNQGSLKHLWWFQPKTYRRDRAREKGKEKQWLQDDRRQENRWTNRCQRLWQRPSAQSHLHSPLFSSISPSIHHHSISASLYITSSSYRMQDNILAPHSSIYPYLSLPLLFLSQSAHLSLCLQALLQSVSSILFVRVCHICVSAEILTY